MDGWKVSHKKKANGVYFTIANLPRTENWKVIHKIPICLMPPNICAGCIMGKILEEVRHTNRTVDLHVGDKLYQAKIAVARIIADTPGVAEICETKNHRSSKFFCKFI